MNETVKKYGIGLISGIVILAVGVAIGFSFAQKGDVSTGSDMYQAGWDAAKKRLTEFGFAFPMTVEAVSVSGVVQEVRTDGMMIKIRPLEPLADPALDMRNVSFDANTKFYQITQKDPIQYQKEVADFSIKSQATMKRTATAEPLTPPQPFVKTEIGKQDIKQGNIVNVVAGSNIKEAKDFVALEVSVQAEVAAQIVPPAPVQ